MAEKGEKRSPTSHRTPSQIKRHGDTYQATPERRKYRSELNKLNRKMGKKGDGKDVAHKKPHSKGGSTTKGNVRLKAAGSNRGHGTSPGGNKTTATGRVKRR